MALGYIADYMKKKKADELCIEGNTLTFKENFFKFRWNTDILVPIEKGVFSIHNSEHATIVTYEFFMYRLFLIAAVMSIVMGLLSHELWVGVACFGWLGGMNWVIALVRQKAMLDEIVDNLNDKNIQLENNEI